AHGARVPGAPRLRLRGLTRRGVDAARRRSPGHRGHEIWRQLSIDWRRRSSNGVRPAACRRGEEPRMRAVVSVLVALATVILQTPDVRATNPPGQWARTETRAACTSFDVLRKPYFGDTHVHTTQSIDAVLFNTLTTPRQAYEFAKGASLELAPFDNLGHGAHTVQLGRPLDFVAVTDHSEGFGAQDVCFDSGAGGFLDGYNSTECQNLRLASTSNNPNAVLQVFLNFLLPVVLSPSPTINPHV